MAPESRWPQKALEKFVGVEFELGAGGYLEGDCETQTFSSLDY